MGHAPSAQKIQRPLARRDIDLQRHDDTLSDDADVNHRRRLSGLHVRRDRVYHSLRALTVASVMKQQYYFAWNHPGSTRIPNAQAQMIVAVNTDPTCPFLSFSPAWDFQPVERWAKRWAKRWAERWPERFGCVTLHGVEPTPASQNVLKRTGAPRSALCSVPKDALARRTHCAKIAAKSFHGGTRFPYEYVSSR